MSTDSVATRFPRERRLLWSILPLLGLLASAQRAIPQTPSAQLQELDQRIRTTVREMGNVESRQATEIRSPVDAAILQITAAGTSVQQGDLLVQLDSSGLQEQVQQQRVALARVQAHRTEVTQRLERFESDRQLRQQLDRLAGQEIEKQRELALGEEGELAVQRRQAQAELNVAQARLVATEQPLEAIRRGVLGGSDAASAKAAATEAREAIEVAQVRLAHLNGPARQLRELHFDVAAARIRFEAQATESAYQERASQAKAELAALQLEQELAESRLSRAEEKRLACTIQAPGPGLVLVYDGGRAQPSVEAGTQVRTGQLLLRLVDPEQLVVRVRVNESRIERVQPGQAARVRFDALPERSFIGRVEWVSRTPEPTSFWNADVKEYAAIVALEEPSPQLKIGLTAFVEIDTGANGN